MEPVFKQILGHPFVTGLTDGSLPMESFAYYVAQDSHNQRDYARALAMVSAKAPDEAGVVMFAAHAQGALEVERQLHAGFARELSDTHAAAFAQPASPTTLAYTSYLLRVCAQGDYAQALAAVLPCYWIYAEVGATLIAQSSPKRTPPLYARWIETYGGEEFGAIVAAVLDAVDRVGESAGAAQIAAMREHVLVTSKYEWMFWDAGLRCETWPV
jgi:thiaminase/transcriptional activator TenA